MLLLGLLLSAVFAGTIKTPELENQDVGRGLEALLAEAQKEMQALREKEETTRKELHALKEAKEEKSENLMFLR